MSAAPGQIMSGFWSDPDVPKDDWYYDPDLPVKDIGDLPEKRWPCEMCKARHVRYAHMMEHSDYYKILAVGATCAARMSGLPLKEVLQREAAAQKAAAELERWMRTGWVTTREGEVTYHKKDQADWRIEMCTAGEGTSLELRHRETEKVILSWRKKPEDKRRIERVAWDLWVEGSALRTEYELQWEAAKRAQRKREEEIRRAAEEARREAQRVEEAARLEQWNRDHPDWDASEQAWSDWLYWLEQEYQRDDDLQRALNRDCWKTSRKGNPMLKLQGHVFVAMEDNDNWQLWMKKPDEEAGRRVGPHLRSFEAVCRQVGRYLDRLPRRIPCPWETT